MADFNFNRFTSVLEKHVKKIDDEEFSALNIYIKKCNEQNSKTPTITYDELRDENLLKEKTDEELQSIMDSAISKYVSIFENFKQNYLKDNDTSDQIFETISNLNLSEQDGAILGCILNKVEKKMENEQKHLIEDIMKEQNLTREEVMENCKEIFENLMK
jgi:hypothetical protein